MPALRIDMLGRFAISLGGEPITTVNTHRLQSLLAYLVLKSGAAQSRQHLSFMFWPDSSESQARTNLRQLLHNLRSALPDTDTRLEITSRSLLWRNDTDFSSDVGEFERALSIENVGSLRERLETAGRLYHGDLLPGLYDEWVRPERQRLRQQYMDALSTLVAEFERTREYPSAISYAERLLSCDPVSEARYQLLLRLHALNGDRAGVLRTYNECVTVLRRELNVEPGSATRKLRDEMAQLAPVERPKVASMPPDPLLPLVGRRKELASILASWGEACKGSAGVVFISGEPGIGKTRLAEEIMRRTGQGTRAAYARCGAAEHNLAYAPVTQWLRSEAIHGGISALPDPDLRELVRVLPELLKHHPGLSPPEPLAEGWHRRRFFEILARAVLNAPEPLLLVLDDLHWCDPETLEWLEFLVHHNPRAKLLILGAAQTDGISGREALRPLLNRLIRDNFACEIPLPALDQGDTAALVGQVSHQEVEAGCVERIYRNTEGNPLFVVESVRAGVGVTAGGEALPPKVRAVLASRLAQLSPGARDLAGLAATIGRAFSLELLRKASALGDAELAFLLDELWQRHIIRAAGKGAFDFSHDKLREVACEELGPARRDVIHRAIAEALEASGEDTGAASAQIASHYEEAGLPARAIPHYVSAAKSGRTRYADREAVGHYTKALEILQSLPQTRRRDEQELEILILLGAALVATQGYAATEVGRVYDRGRLLCEFLGAKQAYFPVLWGSWVFNVVRARFQTAREFATRFRHLAEDCGNATLLAAAHFTMGCTLFHLGNAADARKEIEAALRRYDPQNHQFLLHEYGPDLGVFCECYLAHCLCILGDPERARAQVSSALTRARGLGDPFSITLALVYCAMLHQFLGNADQCRALAEEAAALCDEYGFSYYQAWPPILRGWALTSTGQAADGLGLIREGIDHLRQIQSAIREPYYLGLLAQAYMAADRPDDAMTCLRASLSLMEKSGETWIAPEIHRVKGEILQEHGEPRAAEMSYQRAYSLAVEHGASSFGLRAAIALCRFWTTQGKRLQARRLAREWHDRFPAEGHRLDSSELAPFLNSAERREGSGRP